MIICCEYFGVVFFTYSEHFLSPLVSSSVTHLLTLHNVNDDYCYNFSPFQEFLFPLNLAGTVSNERTNDLTIRLVSSN